jgi:glucose/arabinose dehydrogenase
MAGWRNRVGAIGVCATLAAALALLGSDGVSAPAAEPARDGRGGFELKPLASFKDPIYVHGPSGAGGLVFVVEQRGVIRMIKGGKRLAGKFLDIRGRVEAGGERGLLSVAFSPAYRRNGRLYVFFTDGDGDLRVEEYRRSRRGPRDAREASARRVIEIDHSANANHNGGQLQFGPDGKLYISTGDGGAGGDPPENAQNKNVLLGKILRIDPRRRRGKPYTVPADNPFVGRPGANEVFSLGLRNPFRFSFDRDRRRIAIGDVGQDRREEVDFEKLGRANGANFGWDAFEGRIRFDSPDASPPPSKHEPPIHDYAHSGRNCAITGGYVVRDPRLRSLFGRYVYADFCEGDIRSLSPSTRRARGDRSAGLPRQPGISSFGEDARGRIYVANLFTDTVSVIKPTR